MLVTDANILVRAVLGRRVRVLLETYGPQGVRFYSPEQCFLDAEKYLPALLQKRGKATGELAATLAYLRKLVVSLDEESFAADREEALQRLRGRDAEDWSILAAALSLGCGIWTEDQDFFGSGTAVWTTDHVEIYLRAEVTRVRS